MRSHPTATRPLRPFLVAADQLALLAAVWLAFLVRFAPAARTPKLGELLARPGLLGWAMLSGWLLLVAAELYRLEVLSRRREVVLRVAGAVAFWTAGLIVATYLNPQWAYGRGILALTASGWAALLLLARWIAAVWLRRRPRSPILVVGDAEAVRSFCDQLARRPAAPWRAIDRAGLSLDGLAAEIDEHDAALVVLAAGEERALAMGPTLAALHFSGVPVVAASEIWAWLEERLPLEVLTPSFFLHQPGFGTVHWTLFNRLARATDVVLSAALLTASSPILGVAALLVALGDGLPVLYRQERVGRFGRRFTMLKLRTMQRDAEPGGPRFATAGDPRVTGVGRLLRRLGIDELPQLVNVLKGEMSLVGPRPERPAFVEQLTAEIPYYAFRLAVPPGITGWAQVNSAYARDLEDHRRKLEYDLYFIRERSMRLYLLTLLRTVSATLLGVRLRGPRGHRPAEPEPASARTGAQGAASPPPQARRS